MPTALPYTSSDRTNANLSGLLDKLRRFNAGDRGALTASPGYSEAVDRRLNLPGTSNPAAMSAARLGFNPQAGLGGVGGQYVGNPEARMGVGGVPFSPTRSAGQISNILMDPRQRGGGLPMVAGSPREGFTAMIGRPTPGGLSPEVAAQRQEATAMRRDAARNELVGGTGMTRRQLVQQRGIMGAEARRARMGGLTVDERMQLALPGLAQERVRSGAARDIAGMNVGLGEKQVAAQERMSKAALDLQSALANGNWRAAAKAQRAQIAADRELKNLESTTAMGVAGLQTEAGIKRVESEQGLKTRELDIAERETGQRRADAYGEMARQAAAAGQYDQAEEFRALQQQAMQPTGAQSLPGTQGANRSLPAGVRGQIADELKDDPHALVDELRRRGLNDQEINKELARIYGRDTLLGLSTGRYGRTAANPYGGFTSLRSVDPATGVDRPTLLGLLFPTREDIERDRRRNPNLMYEQLMDPMY